MSKVLIKPLKWPRFDHLILDLHEMRVALWLKVETDRIELETLQFAMTINI